MQLLRDEVTRSAAKCGVAHNAVPLWMRFASHASFKVVNNPRAETGSARSKLRVFF